MTRKILHIDMDAFYASVEILDNPSLRGKPVVVGGSPNSRSVVSTANYEARKYGIHSAMACSRAYRLCPQVIFISPRFGRYKEISSKIHEIFHRYTDLVEALSLDEAWLDVTENKLNLPSATWIAQLIRHDIKQETGLTASAGISYNKFLAKIASDVKKPNGMFSITPDNSHRFLMQLKVRDFFGVGPATEKRLNKLGIFKGADLYKKSKEELEEVMGKMGGRLYNLVRGEDNRPVVTEHERKSLSVEITFEKDLAYGDELKKKLDLVLKDFFRRCERGEVKGKTLTLKVKFFDFEQVTRSRSTKQKFLDEQEIRVLSSGLLRMVCVDEFRGKKVRLLGVGVSRLV